MSTPLHLRKYKESDCPLCGARFVSKNWDICPDCISASKDEWSQRGKSTDNEEQEAKGVASIECPWCQAGTLIFKQVDQVCPCCDTHFSKKEVAELLRNGSL